MVFVCTGTDIPHPFYPLSKLRVYFVSLYMPSHQISACIIGVLDGRAIRVNHTNQISSVIIVKQPDCTIWVHNTNYLSIVIVYKVIFFSFAVSECFKFLIISKAVSNLITIGISLMQNVITAIKRRL